MYGEEKRAEFRYLLEEGLSLSAIGRRLGVSRRTAIRWAAAERAGTEGSEVARYGPRAAVGSLLDPFEELVEVRLMAYPELSAVRVFEEVRAAGYGGGYDVVRRYVREVRPRPVVEPVVRFETPPGHQGQVDFGEFRLPWGKRHALLVVLGYSRLLWFRFFERQTMEVLMRGLEAAFRYFGGTPRELLFDQLKAVIIGDRRASGGELLRNAEFGRFARHWDVRVRACRPYRARTKGKVERPIRYIRGGFFYGRSFASDGDLNDQARVWLEEVANARVHATLKEVPRIRFERERRLLRPLAARPYSAVRVSAVAAVSGGNPVCGRVPVERRSLTEYGRIVESGR